ncbi:MAG: FHA domain-containing protein [Akkermansiaceae bacterium]|nr:FHA domain-containing protein [Armatimonadota bacterium]
MMLSRYKCFLGGVRRTISAARMAVPMLLVGALLCGPVGAQKPASPPGPAKNGAAKPAKIIKFTLVFSRPGSYLCYPVKNGRKGEGIEIKPGQNTLPVEVTSDIDGIEILDEVNGLVATRSVGQIKNNSKVQIKADAFDQLQAVIIELKSKNGQPAARGVVRLTAGKGEPLQYGLSTNDNGSVRFENIALGRAQAVGYATSGDDVVKQTVIIAPVVGGKPQVITLTLPVDVQTVTPASPSPEPSGSVAGAPATIIVNTGESKPETKNDWASGIFGIAILAGLFFWGLRYLKERGMTPREAFAESLQKLGVDSPNAGIPGSPHAGLRSSGPNVVQAPLPSLAELPQAGASTGRVAPDRDTSFAGPRLIGLSGEYAGRTIALQSDTESRLTIGRDATTTIPLASDTAVSRRHAMIVPNGPGWDLMDEASQNGTFVNSRKIEDRFALTSGDVIQIGKARFRFEA